MQERVADLASRQIEVRLLRARDWKENVFKACLLTKHHEVEGLPGNESLRDRQGLKVVGVRNRDLDADGDEGARHNPSLAMDDRLGVPVVGDSRSVAVDLIKACVAGHSQPRSSR